MKILLLLSLILAPSVGFTKHGKSCDEPTLYSKLLSSKNSFVSNTCTEEFPLKLVSSPYVFPFGIYTAHYWKGSYVRPAVNISKIRYRWYDCYGNLLEQEVKEIRNDFNVSFNLKNKNLGKNSTWADIKAAMTDEEAKEAHQDALIRCKAASVVLREL